MKRIAAAILLLTLLGMASCGDEQPTDPARKGQERSSDERSKAWRAWYEKNEATMEALKEELRTAAKKKQRPDPSLTPFWAKVAPEQIAEAKKHGVPVAFENDLGMRFVLIPAGTFLMGSNKAEQQAFSRPASYTDSKSDWYTDQETQHRVTLTRPFYMSVHEVTNAAYRNYRPEHPFAERFDRDQQPVVDVSWNHAAHFARWLSSKDAARTYSLPTEAQWEYACRAGTTTPYAFGETISTDQATYSADPPSMQRFATTDVGSFRSNGWGLHDMHGNALEWCSDGYREYRAGPVTDPLVPETNGHRVLRGGSWRFWSGYVRSARRWWSLPGRRHGPSGHVIASNLGFRLVSPLPEPKAAKRVQDR